MFNTVNFNKYTKYLVEHRDSYGINKNKQPVIIRGKKNVCFLTPSSVTYRQGTTKLLSSINIGQIAEYLAINTNCYAYCNTDEDFQPRDSDAYYDFNMFLRDNDIDIVVILYGISSVQYYDIYIDYWNDIPNKYKDGLDRIFNSYSIERRNHNKNSFGYALYNSNKDNINIIQLGLARTLRDENSEEGFRIVKALINLFK